MSVASNNKRVAKNTLFLYFRMIVIILANLYTTRIVLAELGATDFGIYNVVGGVVMMFSFINSCMTTTTQRYMTFELGKNNRERLNKVFSISLNIHAGIAMAIVLMAETVGLWFLNYELNIPQSQMGAANWVYQFSILTFCVNIIQVPYNAALIAHEKMNIFAYISILEALLKLGIAYVLVVLSSNKLVFYAALVFITQLVVRLVYQFYCKRKYEECTYHWVKDKSLYKEMTAFAGWNLLGSISWLLKGQGINIMLNIFFGPIINAAQGIANQVRQAIMGFIFNFMSAVNPQITKYYATEDYEEMETLTYNGLKYSFILLFLMSLPIMLNVHYILGIWLESVPDYAAFFVVLVLADSLCNTLFDQPLMTSIAATGNIKVYQIVVSSIMLLIVPVGYVALKLGAAPPSVYYVSIIITVIAGFARYYYCHKQLGYSWHRFWKEVLKPVMLFVVVAVPVPMFLRYYVLPSETFIGFVSICVATIACIFLSAWYVGLSVKERATVGSLIKAKLKRS